jgi:hypothetical protein
VYAPGRGVLALNANAFELLFQDSPELVIRTPELARKVADALPIAQDAADALERLAVKRSRVRRKLTMLASRGHLATVTAAQIRDELIRQGLDHTQFMLGDEIVVDSDDGLKMLVELLNEDLMTGALSGEAFVIDRKTPRTA